MNKKTGFSKLIRFWAIIIILMLGGSLVLLDVVDSHQDFNFRADQIQAELIARHKLIAKHEVEHAVRLIRHEVAKAEKRTKADVKERVHEAWAVAQHIYHENRTAKGRAEIQKMIIEALRPVRFHNENGYYFIVRHDGTEVLFADKPELEGKNLLDMQDTQGQYVVKDIIEIAKQSGEGFYAYRWTKPGAEGNHFKKTSFVKRFEPYDWVIGSGVYVANMEEKIKADLLSIISDIRFGTEGYVFVNQFNGDALVANGELVSGTKKLWEIFNKDTEKTKDIFKKEYNAALKPDGDFIEYSIVKFTDPDTEAPKTSFIYGIPELQWIVGAGVYLDDVDAVVAQMKSRLNDQIKSKLLRFILIAAGIIVFFLFIFSRLDRRLKRDFNLFVSFFKQAARSDETIDRSRIRFDEFDQIAENANQMIADRLKAAESLKESEMRFEVFMNHLPAAVFIKDSESRNLYLNKYMRDLFQADDTWIGKTTAEVIRPAALGQKMTADDKKVLLKGHLEIEETIFDKNGVEHIFATHRFPIELPGGEKLLAGIALDISECKRSEAWLKNVFEASPLGIALVLNREIQLCNEVICRMLGYASEEILKKNARMLYLNDEAFDRTGETIASLSSEKKTTDIETRWVRKDGSAIDCYIRYALLDPESEDKIVLALVDDITEKKKEAAEKRQLENQLTQAQKMESVGRLAGGVAHDYNNALSVIIGFTEMAINDADPAGLLHDNLNEVLSAANRAKDITRQLLAFARKQTIAPKVFDLNESVEGMLKMLRRLIGEDIDLTWSPGPGLWPVKMDPSQIDQVLANLCVNARDAIDGVGKVTIETKNAPLEEDYCANRPGFTPGEFVMLAVSDNGCGMDKKTLDNIFEPFFTTKEVGKGTGLGLATVYGIAKQNNGFINAYSEPGQGTTIKIYLPRHAGEAVETKGKSTAPIPTGRGETILVVEDDTKILKLCEKILDGLGYTVLTADTPSKAMDLAEAHADKIHLVITDVVMPEMNGRELVERLQTLYPKIKYLYMSGYTANAVAHRGVLEEGLIFIQKPFSKRDLAATVRKAMDAGPDAGSGDRGQA